MRIPQREVWVMTTSARQMGREHMAGRWSSVGSAGWRLVGSAGLKLVGSAGLRLVGSAGLRLVGSAGSGQVGSRRRRLHAGWDARSGGADGGWDARSGGADGGWIPIVKHLQEMANRRPERIGVTMRVAARVDCMSARLLARAALVGEKAATSVAVEVSAMPEPIRLRR